MTRRWHSSRARCSSARSPACSRPAGRAAARRAGDRHPDLDRWLPVGLSRSLRAANPDAPRRAGRARRRTDPAISVEDASRITTPSSPACRLAHHGIISNNMRAADIPGEFTLSNREVHADPRWWGGEPIWNTAEKQGRIAGGDVLARIGSRDRRPAGHATGRRSTTTCRTPSASTTSWTGCACRTGSGRRSSRCISAMSTTPATDDGPDSEEVRNAVMRVDRSIGDLVAGVEQLGLDRSRALRRGQRSRHGGAQPRSHDRARRLHRRGHR